MVAFPWRRNAAWKWGAGVFLEMTKRFACKMNPIANPLTPSVGPPPMTV